MAKPKIVVVGSSNTDMVVKSTRFPEPGETITEGTFFSSHGGKGANQAVALARLGAEVTFVSCIGEDTFGSQALEQYKKEGIDTTYVTALPGVASGIALILVNRIGENMISVASGANALLTPAHIDQAAEAIKSANMLVMQLEVPLETVEYAADIAAAAGVPVILDPAPAPETPLPESLLKNIYCIKPNENEATRLTGVHVDMLIGASEQKAAKVLLDQGVKKVVITRGDWPTYCIEESGEDFTIQPLLVKAVDTTGAGDVFNAALAYGLSTGATLDATIKYATMIAAISVTKMGTQPSFPYASNLVEEIEALRSKLRTC
ncbi:MAG: ribokinase [Planctomycetia bacterium]|nr:ribokinase [Planctomycetia bacterium]